MQVFIVSLTKSSQLDSDIFFLWYELERRLRSVSFRKTHILEYCVKMGQANARFNVLNFSLSFIFTIRRGKRDDGQTKRHNFLLQTSPLLWGRVKIGLVVPRRRTRPMKKRNEIGGYLKAF